MRPSIRTKFIFAAVIIFLMWIVCRSLINMEVAKKTHRMQSDYEQKIANIKIELENQKIQIEKDLKLKIVDIDTEKEKCKLQLEIQNKKNELKQLSKKNPQEFKKILNKSLGVKEKKK